MSEPLDPPFGDSPSDDAPLGDRPLDPLGAPAPPPAPEAAAPAAPAAPTAPTPPAAPAAPAPPIATPPAAPAPAPPVPEPAPAEAAAVAAAPMVGAPGGRDLSESIALLGRIRRELGHAVVGQEEVVDQVLSCLVASGHVLLEGPPGLGKTLMVLALAQSFGGRFSRVQFTPDLMPADVTGHAVLDPTTGEFRIRKGPAFTNLLLADEINRAPAKTQAALLEVMQEMQVSIEGQALPLEGPYMVLATQNPLEHEGTYPLPEAQLDRFLMKVLIEHAKEKDEELAVVRKVTTDRSAERLDVSSVDEVASAKEILDLQAAAASLTVDERNLDYAVRIVRRTRRWPGIRVGAGPRGGIALVRVARARALLESRDYVTPDDIKGSALPVLRHRILLAPELEIEGRSPDDLLASLIDDVQAPRT